MVFRLSPTAASYTVCSRQPPVKSASRQVLDCLPIVANTLLGNLFTHYRILCRPHYRHSSRVLFELHSAIADIFCTLFMTFTDQSRSPVGNPSMLVRFFSRQYSRMPSTPLLLCHFSSVVRSPSKLNCGTPKPQEV